jgi:hypothetical protein
MEMERIALMAASQPNDPLSALDGEEMSIFNSAVDEEFAPIIKK